MEGYRADTYGNRLADVYDEWYPGVSDVAATTKFLGEIARQTTNGSAARILELAVGTGRLALPLADLGHDVTGIDISDAMLERLQRADDRGRVTTIEGDMVEDLPPGPFDLVFVAYNSLFMLTESDRQAACFAAVASVLTPGGAFVVEAFIPDDPPRAGPAIEIRSMTADRVVLSLSIADPDTQRVSGQFVDLADGQPVRLRPWHLRYSTPHELDGFADQAGLHVTDRYADVRRAPLTDDSPTHVTVYRRPIQATKPVGNPDDGA